MLLPSLLTGILPNLSHPLSLGALLFLFTTLLAQTGALDPSVGWQWIDFLTRLIVVCLLTVSLANTPRRIIGVVAVVACSLGFYATKAGLASLIAGVFEGPSPFVSGGVDYFPVLRQLVSSEIDADHVLLLFGYRPNSDGSWLQVELERDARGYLKVDEKMETSCKGVFAIGDVAEAVHPSIPTALGSATKAAREIARRLQQALPTCS